MTIEETAIKCIAQIFAEDDASKILKERYIEEWTAIYNKRLQIRKKKIKSQEKEK